jgi:hypothetical protein
MPEQFIRIRGSAWFFDFNAGRRAYRLCGGGKRNPFCLGVLLVSEEGKWPTDKLPNRRVRKALDLLERKFNRQNSQPQA